ncbi:ABC transporter ATP-binding protein [Paenibacillus alvei]|uniref:ABC transporter ATP-binding protein n=1 Tax=Paenibacillus alvei TaxID=44250 RepID=UPI002280EEE1|nr:ABC transporter ATP-binding protein [Paenibacillus alvei]
MSYAVELHQVVKSFKSYKKPFDRMKELIYENSSHSEEYHALSNVSLKIPAGCTIGLIGQNGSGKSTLLQVICGILKPTSGDVKVSGRISALLELGAGFNPEFTGVENVYMNGAIQGFTKEEMDKRFPLIEEFAEIGDFINKPVKTYSSGMYVRLAFAAAINIDPDILIVDEALAVGDLYFQLKCIEKIRSFKESGKTIIYVTHDTYSVKNICDYAVWLDHGQIVQQGDPLHVVSEFEDFMKRKSDLDLVKQSATREDSKNTNPETENFLNILGANFYEYKTKVVKQQFEILEPLTIEITYELLKEISDIVAGVAIYSPTGAYICGLNTKLDQYSINPQLGGNKLRLHYDDIKLLPGTYHIHVGFFEKEAIGRLDYKSNVASFNVISSSYKGEGLFLLDHTWEDMNHV